MQYILGEPIEINECDSHPCMNGATCNDAVNAYNCTCVGGYEGVNCENGMFYCHVKHFEVDQYTK